MNNTLTENETANRLLSIHSQSLILKNNNNNKSNNKTHSKKNVRTQTGSVRERMKKIFIRMFINFSFCFVQQFIWAKQAHFKSLFQKKKNDESRRGKNERKTRSMNKFNKSSSTLLIQRKIIRCKCERKKNQCNI